MKNRIFTTVGLAILVILVPFPVAGQSNERVDELLRQVPAEQGHVAYMVLTTAGILNDQVSAGGAFRHAQQVGLLPPDNAPDDPVTFGLFAHLMLEAFSIPGGAMYRAFPGPRYAAREVVARQWSRQRRTPRELIDGETVMRILSVYYNQAVAGGTR
jgi:hypothetical protein